MKFLTLIPIVLALGASAAARNIGDNPKPRPIEADIVNSEVQLVGRNSINPGNLERGALVKRECQEAGSYGCSDKGWCWKECGAGNWCWTAYNGGSGQWKSCGSVNDCSKNDPCSIGGCDDCGCSGCTK